MISNEPLRIYDQLYSLSYTFQFIPLCDTHAFDDKTRRRLIILFPYSHANLYFDCWLYEFKTVDD